MDRPSPVPMPIGLVVKNGSNALAITSGVMPVPVSDTHMDTYCPGDRLRSRAVRSSSQRLAVSTVILPPSGMASRALMHRFSRAFSSWPGSTRVGHSPAAATISSVISGPTVRWSSSSMPRTSRFTSVGLGSRVWRREKASSRCVKAAARLAAPWAAFT